MSNEINIYTFVLIGLSIPCLFSVLISYYLYMPYFRKIVKKEDPILYLNTGDKYLYLIIETHIVIYQLFTIYKTSSSKRIKIHASILRVTLGYALIILMLDFLVLIIVDITK